MYIVHPARDGGILT